MAWTCNNFLFLARHVEQVKKKEGHLYCIIGHQEKKLRSIDFILILIL